MFKDYSTAPDYTQDKRCLGCDKVLPRDIEYFRENSHLADGFSKICYECEKAYKAKTTNKCCKCKRNYPLSGSYWYKNKNASNGMNHSCIVCTIEQATLWQLENPERTKQKGLKWRTENKEHDKEVKAQYYQKNADYLKQRSRIRYWNNRELAREKSRQWYRNNLDRARINRTRWLINNPEGHNTISRNRRARKRNGGKHTQEELLSIFTGHCYYCNYPIVRRRKDVVEGVRVGHVDHYMPLARGGSNTIENLVWACETCNLKKHDRLPEEFIKSLRK